MPQLMDTHCQASADGHTIPDMLDARLQYAELQEKYAFELPSLADLTRMIKRRTDVQL